MEWKVPSHGMPSATPPSRWPMRSFISRAALFVNVTARICDGNARRAAMMWAIRVVTRGSCGAGPRQNQHGPVDGLHREALLRIQAVDVTGPRLRARHSARSDTAGSGLGRQIIKGEGIGQGVALVAGSAERVHESFHRKMGIPGRFVDLPGFLRKSCDKSCGLTAA